MKPALLKGTRDFGPIEVVKRNYIFETARKVFVKYGFAPIETPAMEALSTLTGKYGEEGDKLLFKILNNGDFLAKADEQALEARASSALTNSIAKRGLRYDLTVPFARFVVLNQNEIQLPFKRYQMQPVWRADRPQKGRYQEFYQCDVDVVGSDSLMYEAELVNIYHEVLKSLGICSQILINNRKLLYGIAEQCNAVDKFVDLTIAIDKLDKVGKEGVEQELNERGFSEVQILEIFQLLSYETLEAFESAFTNSETGRQGVAELRNMYGYLKYSPVENLVFDPTLARGLGYYTGCIFEVKVDTNAHPEIKMGSIGGGGRYADLTSTFGLNGVSGVGVSFGIERIFDVMEELNLFPNDLPVQPTLLLVCFDEPSHLFAFEVAQTLRAANIRVDVYPDHGKMNKQMKYADQRKIAYVGVIGSDEVTNKSISLKNMETGEQQKVSIEALKTVLG